MRIISRLDIKGPNLVKGVHLEGLRALGDPTEFAKSYFSQGADELLYVDSVASLYGRNLAKDLVKDLSSEIFIPMSVGGGLRNLNDLQAVLAMGADKVVVNTAAIERPKFISEIVDEFGASTLIVAVNGISGRGSKYEVMVEGGRQPTGIDVREWTKIIQDLGAGEIAVTSIDREGTGKGFDRELIEAVLENAEVPILVGGGCGSPQDVLEAAHLGVDGVVIASLLHYSKLEKEKGNVIRDEGEGNFEFLRSGRETTKFQISSINEIKDHLEQNGISCRKGQ